MIQGDTYTSQSVTDKEMKNPQKKKKTNSHTCLTFIFHCSYSPGFYFNLTSKMYFYMMTLMKKV